MYTYLYRFLLCPLAGASVLCPYEFFLTLFSSVTGTCIIYLFRKTCFSYSNCFVFLLTNHILQMLCYEKWFGSILVFCFNGISYLFV